MARAISTAFASELLKQATSEGLIALLTIDWDDGVNDGTMRLVLNDTNVTYGGNTFTAAAFGVELPDEDDTDIPMLQVVMQDVDLAIRSEIRKLDSRFPATATLQFGLLSQAPTITTIEQTFSGTIRNIKLSMF